MIEYKLFEQVCERFPNSHVALQKSYNTFIAPKITKKYQMYINDASFWKHSLSPEFETIEGLAKHLNEIFEKYAIKKLDGYPFILKEEQTEKESFINLEEVKKEIEYKLEKKYEKELQKLSTLTVYMEELKGQVNDYRREKYKLEEELNKSCEELSNCYNLFDELNELRSHYNRLTNHWLVKLLKL